MTKLPTTIFTSNNLTSNTYRSYLVRFWQSNDQGRWRASAQCVQTGNTMLFGNIESLLTFLHTEIEGNTSQPELTEVTHHLGYNR